MTHAVSIAAACCVLVLPLAAQRSPATEALLLKGLHAALQHEYVEARSAFESASRMDPSDPASPVLLAGLLHQSAEDLSAPFDRHTFDSLLTQAEVRATSSSSAMVADQYLWRSTAKGMLSVIEAQSSEWMAAIRDALASASEAQESLGRDPGLIDAGLPMGNYLYWRSRKTEALQWLPFIADDRDEGIRLLERCAREGRYHRWASISSLIWILHDAGELERAEGWARTGLSMYPGNRTYLAGLAKVQETRGAFRDAAQAWGSIAGSLRRDPAAGRYAIFSALVNQFRCAQAGGDHTTAGRIMAEIALPGSSEVPDWIVPRLAAKRKEWEGLQKAHAIQNGRGAAPQSPR